jgi:3-methyladenine DNA glycosylase AlkD
MPSIASQIQACLSPLADPLRAAPMCAYMLKQFPFLGIAAAARRAAIAPVIKAAKGASRAQLMQAAQLLWQCDEREYQYAAIDLLARYWTVLALDDVAPLLSLAQQKSWWDSVDGLAGVVGDVIGQHGGQPLMDQAILSDTLWVRRIAMLHQLGWRADTDQQRLFAYALTLAHEKDFFIRKAIGWALRDYARHDPSAVQQFLQAERAKLSPLTVREAGKHLSQQGR